MPVCDFDCFHCRFADCIAESTEILRHENNGRKYQKRLRDAEITGFARIILDYRHNLKLSQRQFAALLGISSTAIGLWEIGKNVPSTESWDKLVAKFPDLAQYRQQYEKEI